MESYFTETFMESITSYHKLIYGLYFIEALVLKWISKKETVLKKNNPKEQTEQIEKSLEDNTDMLMGNNEQEPLNNIVDIDKTESIKTLSNKSFKNKMNVIKHKLYKKKIAGNKNKPKHSNKISWSNKCYICRDYGDLICCDSCSNVAHLFCVCLEVLRLLIFRIYQMFGTAKDVHLNRNN